MVRKPEKANGHNNNAQFPSLPSTYIKNTQKCLAKQTKLTKQYIIMINMPCKAN